MKAKKLPSGSWRLQVYDYTDENGKKHLKSFTAPTKAECEYIAAQFKKDKSKIKKALKAETLKEVILKYIEMVGPTLSPTTLCSYKMIIRVAFTDIMEMPVDNLTDDIIQAAINKEMLRKPTKKGGTISAKTVKNEWGLIATALRHRCNRVYNIRLPKVPKKLLDLPEPKLIADAIKDTEIELPCLLALWCGMRMSEIKGLWCGSIKKNIAYIEQVTVTVNREEVTKPLAKTNNSIRTVDLAPYIVKLINNTPAYINYVKTGENGPLCPITSTALYKRFTRLMKKQGINLSFHGLRHVFASAMLNRLNVPSKLVELQGGWSNADTLNRVYSSNIGSALKEATAKRDEYFSNFFY